MNTEDNITDAQCRACGGRIAEGEGVYDDPDGDELGDGAYNHKNCVAYHERCLAS